MTHAHQFSETVIAPELWICAPSRALTVSPGDEKIDHARIDAAVSTLRELGWSVKEAANVRKVHKSFAGTDAERAAGFEEAMCAPHQPVFPSPDFWLRYGLFHHFLPLDFSFL